MPIESGYYIITNVQQRNVAFLPDPNDNTPLVGRDERGDAAEQWYVKAHANKRHSIWNRGHKKHANTKVRASPGEHVEGRDDEQQWIIEKTDHQEQFTIATIDMGRVWGLDDGSLLTPVKLLDPPSDFQIHWTFQKPALEDGADPIQAATVAKRQADQEKAERIKAEQDVATIGAQVQAANQEARQAVEKANNEKTRREAAELEVERLKSQVQVARQEAEQAGRMLAEETTKKEAAEVEVARLEAQARKDNQVELARRMVAEATMKKEAVEAEVLVQAVNQEAEQAKKKVTEKRARREAAELEVERLKSQVQVAKHKAERARSEATVATTASGQKPITEEVRLYVPQDSYYYC